MADINQPTSYPSEPSIFAVVAETQRVANQILRSNPLANAITTYGLMQWVGRYQGNYLWIGEFFPADPNQHDTHGNSLPQMGFVVTRDDPQKNIALSMYDWDPYVGGPLRQKLALNDADGRHIFAEGESGGWGWPRFPAPMMPNNSPYRMDTSDTTVCFGRSQVVGRHVEYMFNLSFFATANVGGVLVPAPFGGVGAGSVINWYLEIVIGSSNVRTAVSSAVGFQQGTLDLGSAWRPLASDFMLMNLHAWFTANPSNCCLATSPVYVHNYTQWTNRQTEGI